MAVDENTRAIFRAQLLALVPIDDADFVAIEPSLRVRELRKGDVFLAAGDIAVDAGTVLSGVLREYYPLEDGREVTRNFAGPNDGVGSLSDLISGAPSKSSVAAETDARLAVLPWKTLRAAADRSPALDKLLAVLTERLYVLKSQREYELLALDAKARYVSFKARFAALEDRIALKQVASYVGITPEHLSRLRKKIAERSE